MIVTVWPARENLQSFSALWRFEQGQGVARQKNGSYSSYGSEAGGDREGRKMTLGLLVTSQFNHTVREYNATTGAFVKVAASGGALSGRRG